MARRSRNRCRADESSPKAAARSPDWPDANVTAVSAPSETGHPVAFDRDMAIDAASSPPSPPSPASRWKSPFQALPNDGMTSSRSRQLGKGCKEAGPPKIPRAAAGHRHCQRITPGQRTTSVIESEKRPSRDECVSRGARRRSTGQLAHALSPGTTATLCHHSKFFATRTETNTEAMTIDSHRKTPRTFYRTSCQH